MNLLDGLKSALGNQGIESIAGMLGENTHNTQMAATSGAASILASLMQGAASNNGGGAANILKMITSGGHDGSMLGNVAGLLSGGESSGLASLMSGGSGILSSLMGDKSSGVADLLGSITGVKSSSANSIMSMVAPMLLGMIGKNVGTGGVGSLVSLLMGQSDAVKAALPTGLSSLLGFNNFNPQSALAAFTGAGAAATTAVNQATSTVTNTVNTVQDEVENVGGGFGNWWPWLIGALALLGALFYFKSCGNNDAAIKDAEAAAKAKAKMVQDSIASYTKKMAAEASNALANFVLPGGTKIEFPKGSVEDQLIGFVNDKAAAIDKNKWFNFEGLNFDTNKATLKAGSEAKLGNVAAIMKAFPAVTLKIGGYTDNVGKPENNKGLSDARAKTVMAELVKLGVDAKRLTAEGYGQEHPAATNDTEEGRAKNRRIDISVRTK